MYIVGVVPGCAPGNARKGIIWHSGRPEDWEMAEWFMAQKKPVVKPVINTDNTKEIEDKINIFYQGKRCSTKESNQTISNN